MNADRFYILDNPAWYSLCETHRHFAIAQAGLLRYQPAIVSFLAFDHAYPQAFDHLDELTTLHESFFIIGILPSLPGNYTVETRLTCEQMICREPPQTLVSLPTIEKLGDDDEEQMLALINLVQPGYFLPGTRLMGDYYGIRDEGNLVAMAGERMKMDGMTEISAVVTHPSFTGRQYAQHLVAHTANKNLARGLTPFLHVAATNERAIAIYRRLGFVRRRFIDFCKIRRER